MKLQEQAERYLAQATNRKRNAIGGSSTAGYASYIRKWIVPELGHLDIADVNPATVKPLVEKMVSKQMAPATISLVIGRVKAIVKSVVDEKGQPVYPMVWNNEFMDIPAIVKADQSTPVLVKEALQIALERATGQSKALYTMLAASGARISELRALRAKPESDTDSFWSPEKSVIFIRSTFAREIIQPWTKTDAGIREVDLHPEVNTYLMHAGLPKTGWLFRGVDDPNSHYLQATADRHLKEDGVETGFHSFRRFRITRLESQGVPGGLQRYWTGHAPNDVHESYIKMGADIAVRKEWAVKAGLGFSL